MSSTCEREPLVAGDDDVPLSAFTRVAPSPRAPSCDKPYGVALLALVAFVVVSGSFAWKNSNAHDLFRVIGDPEWARDPRNCPSSASSSLPLSKGHGGRGADEAAERAARLLRASLVLVPTTLAASLGAGALAVLGLRRAPLAMAKAAVACQVALPVFIALILLANGFGGPAAFLAVGSLLTALVFYLWRDKVELCARLLGLASESLAQTPALVPVALLCDAAAIVAGAALALFAAAFATNGKVVAVAPSAGGAESPACAWRPAPYAPPLAALASLVALWASMTLSNLKVFVVSSTVASSYFDDGAPTSGEEGRRGSPSPLRSSLRSALGPQFGTLSLAGLVMTLTQLARSLVDSLQRGAASDREGEATLVGGCFQLLAAVAAALARGALAFVDYLTKFAVVAAAVSGRGLLASGRGATRVLRSALLDAFGVWYFPPLLLGTWTAAAGVVWGLASGLAYHEFLFRLFSSEEALSSRPRPQESAALGFALGALAWAALSAAASVLLSAVDALFFCYAADRARAAERGEEGGGGLGGAGFATRPEVHAVFDRVPCGVVVEQPDGGISYGAPLPTSTSAGGGKVKKVPPSQMFRGGGA